MAIMIIDKESSSIISSSCALDEVIEEQQQLRVCSITSKGSTTRRFFFTEIKICREINISLPGLSPTLSSNLRYRLFLRPHPSHPLYNTQWIPFSWKLVNVYSLSLFSLESSPYSIIDGCNNYSSNYITLFQFIAISKSVIEIIYLTESSWYALNHRVQIITQCGRLPRYCLYFH